MNLLTLGDSFTYGEELEDRSNAWPSLVANQIGYKLVNLGVPANSNTGICRQLVEYFATSGEIPNLVIIGWSSPGRMEYSDAFGNFSLWPGFNDEGFRLHHPWRLKLSDYLNEYHNDEYLYVKYLQDIIFVQNFLKSQNVKCLMLTTFANNYYKKKYCNAYHNYEKLIDVDNFIGWPNYGMSEWTIFCQKGPGGHFLEQGHQRVAKKINEHIRNLSWIS
jgi:hypothetical protein